MFILLLCKKDNWLYKMTATKAFNLTGSYTKYLCQKFMNNCLIIINKFKNLEETNLKILINKIRNFETIEAINRIKIMRLLWPNNQQVAFLLCLVHMINGNSIKAKAIIDKFINSKDYKFYRLAEIIKNEPDDTKELFYSGLNFLEISDIYNEVF